MTALASEVDVAGKHVAALTSKLKAIQDDLEARIQDNLAKAKEIIRTQLDAARRIDEKQIAARSLGAARGRTNGVGIYDRDYYRQERPGFSSACRTARSLP